VFSLFKLISLVALASTDFSFTISSTNIMIGLGISIGAGLIAGIVPAVVASNMKPVDAIRY
jgi:putative ABC transport system permease protein